MNDQQTTPVPPVILTPRSAVRANPDHSGYTVVDNGGHSS